MARLKALGLLNRLAPPADSRLPNPLAKEGTWVKSLIFPLLILGLRPGFESVAWTGFIRGSMLLESAIYLLSLRL